MTTPSAPRADADEAAVAVEALRRTFGPVEAVDGITFRVGRGELFGLVGPDGAGKTTTLRMLAGVLPPTGGDARVHGISIRDDPEGVKHHIAYMSQRFGLYSDLTVRENIDFYADLYRVPAPERRVRLERLYRFSNLGQFERRLAGQLSGGMKQKLGLCCALIHQPEILLLDEPTFGVDPISRRDLWLIVHEMVAQGVSVLVSTAYMDEAERCDHIALLDHGRIVALDAPAALQQTLAGHLMAVQLRDPRRALRLLEGDPRVRRVALFGDALHLSMASAEREWPAVRAALANAGIEVLDAQPLAPSLEDVFIERVTESLAPGLA